MKLFNSDLKIAPAILLALADEESSLQRLYIAHCNEDCEEECGQTAWSRKLNRDVFEIISPIWVTDEFKCGDIVGADCGFAFEELVWPECVLEDTDLTTLAIVPADSTMKPDEIVKALHAIVGSSNWICELVEERLVVVVLPPDLHQKHEPAIGEALKDKAIIRSPGPWCAKYLEAMQAGDEAKAIEEFLREEMQEAV
jgi:hypothetical protein